MRAGVLDRSIELQSFALSEDGDPTTGQWNTERVVYAEQIEEGQLRRFVSDQTLSRAQRVYRIRYDSEIDPTWRVKDGNDLWTIEGTPEGRGRRTETLLVCNRYDPNEREYE